MKIIFLTGILLICLCACSANNGVSTKINTRGSAVIRSGATNHYRRESPYVNENPIDTPREFDDRNVLTEQRAQKIADAVTHIDGVDKASVSIHDNAAIIGLEISKAFDDASLKKLKNDVEIRARASDKGVRRVAVTVSKELMERMSKAVRSGKASRASTPVHVRKRVGKIVEMLTPPM